MFKIEINGVKNSLYSFTFFNISTNFRKKENSEVLNLETIEIVDEVTFTEPKTTLSTKHFDLLNKINGNVIVYLFIQKERSTWNLISPIVKEKETGKFFQFSLGDFALQGTGGGLSNMCSLFSYLKKLKDRGGQVDILPKITENSLMRDFEYFDSGIQLQDLIDCSIDLINYRKDSFLWIYQEYQRLLVKHKLD